MNNFISDTLNASRWVRQEIEKYSETESFGEIQSGVVWADEKGEDGKLLVPIDPAKVVSEINSIGLTLLNGHDPGLPYGRVLSAASFNHANGRQFVAAIFGFYRKENLRGFNALGVTPTPDQIPAFDLHALDRDAWIEFCVDPREVSPEWVQTVLSGAPIRVEQRELSHNAETTIHELIRLGLPYAAIVWNPFIKVIATEAGKDTYANLKRWLVALLNKAADLNSPIVELISHINSCQVSFIFRGKDIKKRYAAHEALSSAAQNAATLIKNMRAAGLQPIQVTYEFQRNDEIWYPSFAQMQDGTLITNNAELIAIEQLPKSLSLGLILPKQ